MEQCYPALNLSIDSSSISVKDGRKIQSFPYRPQPEHDPRSSTFNSALSPMHNQFDQYQFKPSTKQLRMLQTTLRSKLKTPDHTDFDSESEIDDDADTENNYIRRIADLSPFCSPRKHKYKRTPNKATNSANNPGISGILRGPISIGCSGNQFVKSWLKYICQSIIVIIVHCFSCLFVMLIIKFVFDEYYYYQSINQQNITSSESAIFCSQSWNHIWIVICALNVLIFIIFQLHLWVIPLQSNFEPRIASSIQLFKSACIIKIMKSSRFIFTTILMVGITLSYLLQFRHRIVFKIIEFAEMIFVVLFAFLTCAILMARLSKQKSIIDHQIDISQSKDLHTIADAMTNSPYGLSSPSATSVSSMGSYCEDDDDIKLSELPSPNPRTKHLKSKRSAGKKMKSRLKNMIIERVEEQHHMINTAFLNDDSNSNIVHEMVLFVSMIFASSIGLFFGYILFNFNFVFKFLTAHVIDNVCLFLSSTSGSTTSSLASILSDLNLWIYFFFVIVCSLMSEHLLLLVSKLVIWIFCAIIHENYNDNSNPGMVNYSFNLNESHAQNASENHSHHHRMNVDFNNQLILFLIPVFLFTKLTAVLLLYSIFLSEQHTEHFDLQLQMFMLVSFIYCVCSKFAMQWMQTVYTYLIVCFANNNRLLRLIRLTNDDKCDDKPGVEISCEIDVDYPSVVDVDLNLSHARSRFRSRSHSLSSTFISDHNCNQSAQNITNDDKNRNKCENTLLVDNTQLIQIHAQCEYIYDIMTYIAIMLVPLLYGIFEINRLAFPQLLVPCAIQFGIQCIMDLIPLALVLYTNHITIAANNLSKSKYSNALSDFYYLPSNSNSSSMSPEKNKEENEKGNGVSGGDKGTITDLVKTQNKKQYRINLKHFVYNYGINLKIRYINIMNRWSSTKKNVKRYMWASTIIVTTYFTFYLLYPQRFLCAHNVNINPRLENHNFGGRFLDFHQWQYILCK